MGRSMKVDRRRPWAVFALIAWISVVSTGISLMAIHGVQPSDAGDPSARWPATSSMQPNIARPMLLIFLHPRCPCSVASLVELEHLLTPLQGKVVTRAILYRPEGASNDWGGIPVPESIAAMRDVEVVRDPGGLEARRFGVRSSGHVLLFDPDGTLLFSGGITPARGHEGDSIGRDTIASLIVGKIRSGLCLAPVYGCPIVAETSRVELESIP